MAWRRSAGWTRCGDICATRPPRNPPNACTSLCCPAASHLPEDRQRLWTYFKLWPNVAFDVYPDQVDFMQIIPISAHETLVREIAYALPDDRREMQAARYLNWRINRRVSLEDKALIERVQAGMGSRSYTPGPLGSGEVSCAVLRADAQTHSGEPSCTVAGRRLANRRPRWGLR